MPLIMCLRYRSHPHVWNLFGSLWTYKRTNAKHPALHEIENDQGCGISASQQCILPASVTVIIELIAAMTSLPSLPRPAHVRRWTMWALLAVRKRAAECRNDDRYNWPGCRAHSFGTEGYDSVTHKHTQYSVDSTPDCANARHTSNTSNKELNNVHIISRMLMRFYELQLWRCRRDRIAHNNVYDYSNTHTHKHKKVRSMRVIFVVVCTAFWSGVTEGQVNPRAQTWEWMRDLLSRINA